MLGNVVTLGKVFDTRHNALTTWRLVLAIGVIFWHTWPLTGRHIDVVPATRLLGEIFADGFFAVSGFLITAAWLRRPYLKEYWAARALRIFPGLWVCLTLIAFVIAPIAASVRNIDLSLSSEIQYVLNNAALNVNYTGIDGTPSDVPMPDVWNGSIWTLFFVLVCDVMVSVVGFLGLLKRRWTIPTLFTFALCWSAYVSYSDHAQGELPTMSQAMARFILVFLTGAMFFQYQNKIPANWWLVGLSITVVAASGWIQNYRLIGAVPLAYMIIVSGALIRKARLTNDLSYGVYIYAFPVQQFLVMCGLAGLNPLVFFIVATATTLPLAAFSWFLVEKRAVALKRRLFSVKTRERVGKSPPAVSRTPQAEGAARPSSQ